MADAPITTVTEPTVSLPEQPKPEKPPVFKQAFAEAHQIGSLDAAKTAAEQREAQLREYGMFIAAEDIYIDGALAFRPGHAVPISHVSDEGPVFPGQVALRQTQKGEPTAAAKAIAEAAAADPGRG